VLLVSESRGADPSAVRRIAATGQTVPGGGAFDRFSVESLPIVAPINSKGQVAFFATVVRGRANEGFFVASGARISKVAADGDPVPGGGVFSGFGRHPVPALNDAGELAFSAAIAGARAVEGIFVASPSRVRAIVLAGGPAPDIPSGTFANVDTPAINARGDVAFLATVRRGRESLEVIYLHSGGKTRKVVAQGDPAPAGGTFAGFGPPSLNGKGLVVFGAVVLAASIDGGTAPVAVFMVGRGGAIAKVAAVGDALPGGGTLVSFGLYPFAATSNPGAITFATAPDAVGAGAEGIFAIDPA